MKGNPKIIHRYNVASEFNAEQSIAMRVQFLEAYLMDHPQCNGYVLGISGGIDSAVAAALLKQATCNVNKKLLAMLTPYHNKNMQCMLDVVNALQIDYIVRDIGDPVDLCIKRYCATPPTKLQIGNRMARQRMIEWYDVALQEKLIVVGTDHATENIVGYFTKYGDGGVDINPLMTLDKRQIMEIAKHAWPFGRIPEHIIARVPSADLWDGQTDEDELGISYDAISDYLENKDLDMDVVCKIETLYNQSMHKRCIPYI